MVFITLVRKLLECLRCGHRWFPRGKKGDKNVIEVRICPKCKSAFWDRASNDV